MSGLSFIFDTLCFYACEEPAAFPALFIAKLEAPMNATTLSDTETAAPPVTMYKLGQKALVTRTNSGTKEAYAALMTLVPYGRIGEPEDSRVAI
jgi:hypothetical protein